jgi:tetratricopeptide (TPR) repeat protein
LSNPLIVDWELQLNTKPRKVIAIILILATSGTLIYRTWWLFLAAWITREFKDDPAIYERAISYHPDHADYHVLLAQIYNSSTRFLDLKRAGEEFKEAVRLNPHKSQHWQELAKWYEVEGQIDLAREAIRKALETDPNYAQTHWFAANLYLRFGDTKEADFELRRTADLDIPEDADDHLTQVLDLVWRAYEDPDFIVATHIPNSKRGNLTALNYFISKQSERGATLTWARLKTFETTVPERFPYINYLIGLGKPHDAWQIFSFPMPPVAFYNGSFETETLGGGFDWRISSNDDAEARRDTTVAKEGLASLLVSFSGKQNIDYSGVAHELAVQKGKAYNLTFWMKTEGISTNEGMYVEVDGQASPKQLGTTYWQQFRVPFTASSDLVTVRLRRVPTNKFDNLLKGKVWLDAFDLAAIQ